MNKEIIKAISNKKKERKIRKWWSKNGYKVLRAILFPLWIGDICYEKYIAFAKKREAWDENRIKEILEYYIPRRAEWDEENNTFYFFDNGYGWSYYSAKRFLKRKDRRFWKFNVGWCGGKIRDYLLNSFELEGFTKEVGFCFDGRTDVNFILKKEKTLDK